MDEGCAPGYLSGFNFHTSQAVAPTLPTSFPLRNDKSHSWKLTQQKLPNLPWLLLRHSWNLRLPFIFSPVETCFCPLLCNPSTPLQRTHSSLHSVPQTDSCCVTVRSTGSLMSCEPVWVCLKIACECRLFIMTDLIGLFRPTPSPAV